MEIDRKEKYKRLLARVLKGTATPAEYDAFVELAKFINTDEDPDIETVELLKGVKSNHHYEAGATRVYNKLMRSVIRPTKTRWWIAAAASLLILTTASVIWLKVQPMNTFGNRVDLASSIPLVFKDKQVLHLPDGSTVILNDGSELRYTKDYDSLTREVQLTGEAFFDVAHNPDKPFIVNAGNTVTTVLGTAFNINSTHDNVKVIVTRGKVKVADISGHSETITPNQQVTVTNSNNLFRKEIVDAQKSVAWTDQFVMFEHATMNEAIAKIQAHYDVNIKLLNPDLGRCHIEGRFLSDAPLETVLFIICSVTNSELKKSSDGSFVIDGSGCPN